MLCASQQVFAGFENLKKLKLKNLPLKKLLEVFMKVNLLKEKLLRLIMKMENHLVFMIKIKKEKT